MQPEAKCFCTAITYPKDYVCVLEKLKRENSLDLGSYFIELSRQESVSRL